MVTKAPIFFLNFMLSTSEQSSRSKYYERKGNHKNENVGNVNTKQATKEAIHQTNDKPPGNRTRDTAHTTKDDNHKGLEHWGCAHGRVYHHNCPHERSGGCCQQSTKAENQGIRSVDSHTIRGSYFGVLLNSPHCQPRL